MTILMYEVYMKWSTAEARENLSKLIDSAHAEPQLITNRGRPVAVVIDVEEYEAFRRWRADHPSSTLAAALDELTRVCAEEGWTLPVPARRDRPDPFADPSDDLPG